MGGGNHRRRARLVGEGLYVKIPTDGAGRVAGSVGTGVGSAVVVVLATEIEGG